MPTEESEIDYVRGSKRAWLTMLSECLKHLGYDGLRQLGCDDSEISRVKLVAERSETVLILRSLCKEFGDNDWSDDLHLADVIEKHLAIHLRSHDQLDSTLEESGDEP